MDAQLRKSAAAMYGAAPRMSSATTAELVKTPGHPTATADASTALTSPSAIAPARSVAAVLDAFLVPNTGGRNVCAACETPSPMTPQKK